MVLEGGDEIKGLLYARHCSRCERGTHGEEKIRAAMEQ